MFICLVGVAVGVVHSHHRSHRVPPHTRQDHTFQAHTQATPSIVYPLTSVFSDTHTSSSHLDHRFTLADQRGQRSLPPSPAMPLLNTVLHSSLIKSSSVFVSMSATHTVLVSHTPPRIDVSVTPSHVQTTPPRHAPSLTVTPTPASLSLPTSTVSDQMTVIHYSFLPGPSHPTSLTTPTTPGSLGGLSLTIRLVLYVVPPVGGVLLCVICVTLIICCRKYRR